MFGEKKAAFVFENPTDQGLPTTVDITFRVELYGEVLNVTDLNLHRTIFACRYDAEGCMEVANRVIGDAAIRKMKVIEL